MEKTILEKIKQYETIIIHRHHHPDLDAYGTQLGLKYGILKNLPDKKVYAVGDSSSYFMDATMDILNDSVYSGALVIVCDTSVAHLISDDRYKLAKEVIVIDHHTNDSDINPNLFYRRSEWVSAAETVADLFKKWNFELDETIATHLLGGMIGDSGRYMFINQTSGAHIFEMSAWVIGFKPAIQTIYDYLYLEPLEKRVSRSKFSSFDLTKHNVAYQKHTLERVLESGLDFMTVSRGMLGAMSGIKEVVIWASFTENEEHKILAELRSRYIEIVDIAKKYGGGGHANACGATLNSWEDVNKVLEDLDERGREYHERNEKNL